MLFIIIIIIIIIKELYCSSVNKIFEYVRTSNLKLWKGYEMKVKVNRGSRVFDFFFFFFPICRGVLAFFFLSELLIFFELPWESGNDAKAKNFKFELEPTHIYTFDKM